MLAGCGPVSRAGSARGCEGKKADVMMVRAGSSVGVEVSGRLGLFSLFCSASIKSRSNPVVLYEPGQVMCGDRTGKASINNSLHLSHFFL